MTETQRDSEQRRVENEVAFKAQNLRILNQADGLLDDRSKHELLVGFVCECSNDACEATIEMPIEEFRHLRSNRKQFVVKGGHEQRDIERLVDKRSTYVIVEKFETPPPIDAVQ